MNEASVSFEVGQRLGAGGFGEVSLALMRQGTRAQLVALKRIRPELAETPDYLLQFEREAQICAQLDHPHVVKLAAFGSDAVGPYLALEYVHGRPASAFDTELKRYGEAMPLDVGLSICRDAARGLTYAHQLVLGDRRGLVHRDLSPDNVLVSYEGVAKLADFGIARALDSTRMTSTGQVKGKFGYMAPELFDGADADVRTDLFAFAATIYRLLAGESPFPARNEAELLKLVAECKPVTLSEHREVPDELEDWVMAALQKRPDARPQSALSVLTLLDAHVHHRPDEGRSDVRACMRRLWPRQANGPLPRVANAPTELKQVPRSAPSGPRWPARTAVALVLAAVTGAAVWLATDGDDPTRLRALDGGTPGEAEAPPGAFGQLLGDITDPLAVKPPKPAALTRLDVKVSSVPPGASVQLEGVKVPGRTPLVLEGLRPGETYHLDVYLPGWFAWSQTFVADGHDLTATLAPMPRQ